MPTKNVLKSKFYIDEENYKKVKYEFENLVRKKKREFCEINLKRKINKSKELWKTLKANRLKWQQHATSV